MKKQFILLYLILINSFTFSLHAENMLEKVRDYFYTTRLFAGYHSSPEEKAAAQEELQRLQAERDYLRRLTLLTSEEYQKVRDDIAEINKEIIKQEIILGKRWTGARTAAWIVAGT